MRPKCTLFVSASFLFIVTATSCRVYHTTATPSAPPTEDRVVVVKEQPRVIVVRQQPDVVVVNDPAKGNSELARRNEMERLEREKLEKERIEYLELSNSKPLSRVPA